MSPDSRVDTEFRVEQYWLCYPDGIERHWWHLARNRIVLRELGRYTDEGPVLDVGCGRGVTIAYLRRHGIDCEGVDLGVAKPLPGLSTHIRYGIAAAELPPRMRSRIGTIILLDVIEHLPHPEESLAELEGAFESLAHVVVAVPAGPELWSNYDDFYGHFRRYTGSMLDRLAEDLGWTLVHKANFFRPAYLPMLLLAKIGMARATAHDAPRGPAMVVHRLVAGAMLADYSLLPTWIRGTSLIATYRL